MMFPPALPPSHSHPDHGLLGLSPCPGWGWVGARAGLVLGMITPPSTPLPLALFSSGSCQGKGGRRRPYDALIFPAPSPTSPPQVPAAPGAAWIPEVDRGGGGRYRVPTPTLPPRLSLTTPISAPVPTPTTPGLSALVCLQNLTVRQFKRLCPGVVGVGAGAWGVEPSNNPTIPPSLPGAPPPLGCEGGRWAQYLGRRGIWWG